MSARDLSGCAEAFSDRFRRIPLRSAQPHDLVSVWCVEEQAIL